MNTDYPVSAPPLFDRKSEAESVCRSCYSTVRGDRYTPVQVAEEIHSDVCLVNIAPKPRFVAA